VPPLESSFTFMTYTSRIGDFTTLIGADLGNGTTFELDSSDPLNAIEIFRVLRNARRQ